MKHSIIDSGKRAMAALSLSSEGRWKSIYVPVPIKVLRLDVAFPTLPLAAGQIIVLLPPEDKRCLKVLLFGRSSTACVNTTHTWAAVVTRGLQVEVGGVARV